MIFKIGDRVKVSSINSRVFCGWEGVITEIPSSHAQRDYGVDIWQDGRPTIGFDEEQLILLTTALQAGSRAWYVAGARFVDGDSIISVQFVTIIDCWDMSGGSRRYVIDLGGTISTDGEKLFADREDADAAAVRLQKLKIKKARELLELHTRWLERLENS